VGSGWERNETTLTNVDKVIVTVIKNVITSRSLCDDQICSQIVVVLLLPMIKDDLHEIYYNEDDRLDFCIGRLADTAHGGRVQVSSCSAEVGKFLTNKLFLW